MKNRITALKTVLLVLICYSLSPNLWAVSPAPDGGYPGGNTAEGQDALFSLTTGEFNTALGYFSLRSDATNSFNTAIGAGTLIANTSDNNTAVGAGALLSNSTGAFNTASGAFALFSNTSACCAVAVGVQALQSNTVGDANTAIGGAALEANTTGNINTAVGNGALSGNTTGHNNTAIGYNCLSNSTIGSDNIALGSNAGGNVLTAGGVICIGANGADVTSTTWIANVYGVTTQSGNTAPVIVSADGQLGTIASSERFKKDIVTMDKASESILSLRPVTFHYKTDTESTPQFGLIAEEVVKVNPALVLLDKEGKPYTVRYDAVNAMLLNEFLKEHKRVEQQAREIQDQKDTINDLTKGLTTVIAQLREQESRIERMSAQLAAASPSPDGLELATRTVAETK